MHNATPALLAFLLVLSLPAMAGVAAVPAGGTGDGAATTSHQISPQPPQADLAARPLQAEVANTTNRLQVTGDVRSAYTAYRPDLGLALASADDRLRVDHDQYTLVEAEFRSASAEEQTAMLQAAYDRLLNRSATLEQRERQAVRAHAAGERSTAQLLQTLIRNHKEAAMLSSHLDALERRADRVPGYTLSSRETRIDRNVFEFHRTSLRSRLAYLADAPTGGSSAELVVTTSQTGYSLAMMTGDTYTVETTRFDHRDESAPDQFEDLEAFDRTMDLYPWAAEHGSPHFQDNSPDHYWTEIGHTQGRLEVYLDAGSGEVHREVQELSASSLPAISLGPGWTDAESKYELTMNRTPTDGPVELTVTENATGEPVDATVTIDGVEVGTTGADGSLWVIPPRGSHKLVATTPDGTINATLTR